MLPPHRWFPAGAFIGLFAVSVCFCAAQNAAQTQESTQISPAPAAAQPASPSATPVPSATPAAPSDASAQPSAEPAAPESSAPAKKIYTVPAGTKVLLQLRSAINTRSAKPGDGVYLASSFPVVVGNRVMIPTGVYVQGVVDRVQRGTVRSKAQLDMHFTSIIFPNGSVVEIPGVVEDLPGAKNQNVKNDDEGTIEQNGNKGRNAGETAKIAIPTGAGVGTIGGVNRPVNSWMHPSRPSSWWSAATAAADSPECCWARSARQ